MAGDWIKIEHTTPDKPEVYQMAELLDIDPDHVMGALLRVWIWADQQLVNGNAPSVTKTLLNRKSHVTGFAEALTQVGWLIETENGVEFTNFDRHNGKTAKNRAVTNRRVSKLRNMQRQCNDGSNAECNGGSVTKTVTREEKRRDKEKDKKENSRFTPPTADEVRDYCSSRNNGISPQQFIDHYEANGWMRGKTKVKDWKACVRTWEKNHKTSEPAYGEGGI